MEAITDAKQDEVRKVCRSGQMSETVVTAVAEAKGVDPLDLDPLFTAVDPDALNRMFSPSVGFPSTSLELRFSMEDCQVVVHGDGEVAVTRPAETEENTASVAPNED